ncbi:phosphatidylserine lipase ABHD16A-like [Tubulanus polymorphus]|uniref:phosphatidylserine lipase ABHD16A-like n=1 Tax=Tubulanus polymorphus TaxID=672921 RepID=UPI003DA58DC5
MSKLWQCIVGPALYRIHAVRGTQTEGRDYSPNAMENGGDQFVRWIRLCYTISCWTSPFLLTFLYRRSYFTPEGAVSLFELFGTIVIFFYGSKAVRGWGRLRNREYRAFLATLENARENYAKPDRKRALREYDFEFFAWPADFRWSDVRDDVDKPKIELPRSTSRSASTIRTLPCQVISYVMAHTFGRRMVYPGTTGLVSALMSSMLLEGRGKLIEEYRGDRAKLIARDANEIDTMFVDRRANGDENGRTLVITCEGNSGFYEVGCMVTPLDAGYSVLGWNHPGFGGSSGVPFPDQEQNAIDVVVQYAIHKLGFEVADIVIFAWSIGGYTASWAGMNYPGLKYIILDATFDDLLPLAVARMPQSWGSLVARTIRTYMNLNVAEQLIRYPGPVSLVRRSRDEMITTVADEVPDPATNRGNDLLTKLLRHRYPCLLCDDTAPALAQWLTGGAHARAQLLAEYPVDDDVCASTFASYVDENGRAFPTRVGEDFDVDTKTKFVLFLASKYMQDFESTHCTPLPVRFFREPWNV